MGPGIFPEIDYGDEDALLHAEHLIDSLFSSGLKEIAGIYRLASRIKNSYDRLEPFFTRFTGPVCARCVTGCCVNRHGFPDYEDMVIFRALRVRRQGFDPTLPDQEPCQYLEKRGCRLERYQRSYRCTWYFCDRVLNRFEKEQLEEYRKFRACCQELASERQHLLTCFGRMIGWRF